MRFLGQGRHWMGLIGPERGALPDPLPSQLLTHVPGLWSLVTSAVSSQTGSPGGRGGSALTPCAPPASRGQAGP